MFATYKFVYLQHINFYVEQIIYIFARYNRIIYTMFLYLQYINFVFAIYNRSLYTIFVYLQYMDFVFATHALNNIQIFRSNSCISVFAKRPKSQFRARNGSPWLEMSSYFWKTEPRAPRSFLNASRASGIPYKIQKSPPKSKTS